MKENKFGKVGIVLLAMLFLMQFAFAETVSEEFRDLWRINDFPWEATAVTLAVMSFAVSAIALMLARVFQSNEMERWAKGEFMFTVSTVFLIAFVILFVNTLATEAVEFSTIVALDRPALLEEFRENPSPFTVAHFYLDRMGTCAKSRYIDLVCAWAIPSAAASIEFTGIDNDDRPIISFFYYMNNLVYYTMYNLEYIIYTIDFQSHLLLFIQQTMLTIFLPIGIIMRAFTLTRGAGNLFIAIALGLYFVYPLMFGVFISISKPIEQFEFQCGVTGDEDVSDYYDTGPCTDSIVQLSNFGFSTISKVVRGSDTIGEGMTDILEALRAVLSEMMLYTVFYPFAAATVVYTFVKAFTIFLGTDAQEFAQGLVKLI